MIQKNLKNSLENKKNEYLQILKDLIKIDTRVIGHGIDGGRELKGQKYLKTLIEKIGGNSKFIKMKEEKIQEAIDNYNEGNPGHNYEDRPNLVGEFYGRSDGRSLILNGHIDTMPYGNRGEWENDPFLGEEINGEIYGLGSTDMKGGLAAALLAVDLLKSAGYKIKGDVIFESVIDEEGGGNGTLGLVQEGYTADGAIVCEPTSLNLQIGHMGFIFYKISVRGKSLHSSQKWKGVNAIQKAIKLIKGLEKLEHNWLMKYKHPLLPPPTLNIGVIEGGEAGSTVPSNCEFKLCLHYYPGLEKEKIENEVKQTLDNVVMGDPWLRNNPIDIEKYQEGSPYEIDANHKLVKTFKKHIPANKEITASPAGNDARLLNNIAGIPTVVYGPGSPDDAHSVNESIDIDEYLESILDYAKFISDWCGVERG